MMLVKEWKRRNRVRQIGGGQSLSSFLKPAAAYGECGTNRPRAVEVKHARQFGHALDARHTISKLGTRARTSQPTHLHQRDYSASTTSMEFDGAPSQAKKNGGRRLVHKRGTAARRVGDLEKQQHSKRLISNFIWCLAGRKSRANRGCRWRV